jgi:hypothetical protein
MFPKQKKKTICLILMPGNHQMFSQTKLAIEIFLLSTFGGCQTFSKPKPMVEIFVLSTFGGC